jgi:hypothetical protein
LTLKNPNPFTKILDVLGFFFFFFFFFEVSQLHWAEPNNNTLTP